MSDFNQQPDQEQNIFTEDAEKFFARETYRRNYPRLASVYDYWDRRRDGKFAANKADFSLSELPVDAVPYCMMVDVSSGGTEFVYRYWGTKCAEYTKQEMTGKKVTDVEPKAVAEENYNSYRLAYETKSALVFAKTHAKTFFLDADDLFLRVPLTDNGVDCDFILTVFEQHAHLLSEVEK